MTINVEDIVYLHCHQQENDGTVVLVGQDGVQRSPIHFPIGGHLLAFLTCLENGLMPNGSLDPPLFYSILLITNKHKCNVNRIKV